MKFGKRFKAAQRERWVYLDYKGLKQLLKQHADDRFLQEVNAVPNCA